MRQNRGPKGNKVHESPRLLQRIAEREKNCGLRIAIIGSPNVGKSVLYNILTGGKASIANWPGSTVEYHVGELKHPGGKGICLIDLPGTYSLLPTSPEEEVTRDYLIYQKPEYIMVLLDALSPEKSLAIVIQAIEAFPGRVFIVVTKSQLAHAHGVHIDFAGLSKLLGVPVIPVSALENIGLRDLKEFITKLREEKPQFEPKLRIKYGILEDIIGRITNEDVVKVFSNKTGADSRWLVLNMLSGDKHLFYDASLLIGKEKAETLGELIVKATEEFKKIYGRNPSDLIIEHRFALLRKIVSRTVVRYERGAGESFIDRLFHNPIIGPLLSLAILLATFFIAFSINTGFPLNIILDKAGFPGLAGFIETHSLSGLLSYAFGLLGESAKNFFGGAIGSLIGDGIINGVGFVLSFLPLILIVFLIIAVLEDTGLVARMSYSFHHVLEPFGLSGKSLFPLMMGIGCNVPAVLSTRALTETERKRALFAVPFIPCQARLAVIIAFTAAFFHNPLVQSLAVLALYMIGFLAAILTTLLLSVFYSKRRGEPRKIELLLEVPPLHKPSWRVVWWYVKENSSHFLKKAGTIIFFMSIITWFLTVYGPHGFTSDASGSLAAILGRKLSFALKPLGLGEEESWKLTFALLEGLVAKEVVLGSLAVIEGLPQSAGSSILQHYVLTGSQVFSFLVIVTIYMPCIATLAAMVGELRDVKKPLLYLVYSILLAFILGYLSYFILSFIL